MHSLLRSGEIRLGFVGAMLEPEAFKYIALAEDRLVLITQNNPHFYNMKEHGFTLQELLSEPMVAREEGSGTYLTLQNYIYKNGLSRDNLHIVARVDDPEAIKNMVLHGVGIAIQSVSAVSDEIADGSLLAFELGEKGLKRDIYLIFRRDTELTLAERRFVTFLKEFRKSL